MRIKNTIQELPKEAKALIALARDQGWEYSKTSGGHHRLVSPQGRIVMNSGTPSDYRSVKNFRAELKRHGLKPRTIPVIVKKEKHNVTTHEIPKETLAIMSQPPTEKKKKKYSGARGLLRTLLIDLARKHDNVAGISGEDIKDEVKLAIPDITEKAVSQGLTYYGTLGIFTRVRYGRYRLTEMMGTPPATPTISAPAPASAAGSFAEVEVEEDIRILDEALAALAKIDQVVRKQREIVKQIAVLKKMWGG